MNLCKVLDRGTGQPYTHRKVLAAEVVGEPAVERLVHGLDSLLLLLSDRVSELDHKL